jgi:molybdopterin-guanine dinucleotide biosynthesis protein A
MSGLAGIILSGGQGSRMNYQNKGLKLFNKISMIEYATQRLSPLVDELIISANHDLNTYQALGYTVATDKQDSHLQGPLLGLHSCLSALPSSCHAVVVNPCDTPLLDTETMQQLYQAWLDNDIDIAIAKTNTMLHPSIFVVGVDALLALENYQPHQQHFGLRRWAHSLKYQEVLFDNEWIFSNINDEATLLHFEKQAKAIAC